METLTSSAETNGRAAWLRERRTGLGGSDAAAVLGLNPYRSPMDVYLDKTGQTPLDEGPTAAMERGRVLEPVAADLYAAQTGRKIRRQPMRRHQQHEWMIGNVDRQILSGEDRPTGVLEIKCPGLRTLATIKAHGLPDRYVVQLQHYLGVYGYEWGSFCLFNAESWQLIHFDLEAEPDLIGEIIERERTFWIRHVLAGLPPEEGETKQLEIPEVPGEIRVMDSAEARQAAEELAEARTLKAAAAELEDAAKERMQGLMEAEGADAAEIPGAARIYWRSHERTSFDKKALAAAHPEIDLSQYEKISSYRSFRFYPLTREEE